MAAINEKIEQIQKKDSLGRYIDIANVHAAALNASSFHNDRPYRSHDGDDDHKNDYGDLIDLYGMDNSKD